jgi:hypothetical protein
MEGMVESGWRASGVALKQILCVTSSLPKSVMAGLVPAIHVLNGAKTWIPGTSPGMTKKLQNKMPGTKAGHEALL